MIASLSEGVEVMQSPALESTDYFMAKLLTKTAYKNEGAVMSHCVAGYFGRHGVEIYSLRNAEKAKPCATIEVHRNKRGGTVQQVKAFTNKNIDPVDEVALNAWIKEVGFVNLTADPWGDEEDDEEDYDGDEEDEEEEDGDEEDYDDEEEDEEDEEEED
jgi:phosphopantothenoylcysteine synthetase/decarboxylase